MKEPATKAEVICKEKLEVQQPFLGKLWTLLFVGIYSNFRGRKTDLTETLSYHLATVTSLAHRWSHVFIMRCTRQQGILHAENVVGMSCDVFLQEPITKYWAPGSLCLKSRSNGTDVFLMLRCPCFDNISMPCFHYFVCGVAVFRTPHVPLFKVNYKRSEKTLR